MISRTIVRAAAAGALAALLLAACGNGKPGPTPSPVTSPVTVNTGAFFAMSDASLVNAKKLLASKPSDAVAQMRLKALLTNAEVIVKAPIPKITDKPSAILPPGATKNDYVSFVDAETKALTDQSPDPKRLGVMIDQLRTLGLAYYFTNNTKFAEAAAERLRVWFVRPATRMLPNLNYARRLQTNPGQQGYGATDLKRLPAVLDAVLLVQNAKVLSPADKAALQHWFGEYLGWLASEAGSYPKIFADVRRVWYANQLVALQLYLGEREAAEKSINEFESYIGAKIKGDGKQPAELAGPTPWMSSVDNVAALYQLAWLAPKAGLDVFGYSAPNSGNLRAALHFLAPYASSDGQWPYPDKPRYELIQPALTIGAAVYGDLDMMVAASKQPPTSIADLFGWSYMKV